MPLPIQIATLLAESVGSGSPGVPLLRLLFAGGVVGYVILALSVAAVALAVAHWMQLREESLSPAEIVAALDVQLARGDVDGAMSLCADVENDCALTRIVAAGLSRYRRSAFGSLELRGALEEAGQEQIARLSRSTDGLGLIATSAPMLGLLGTVLGMVGAFDTISASEGFARPDALAGDISQALVTTMMGLSLALPATAAVTYFRNRIESLGSEMALTVERLSARLEARGGAASVAVQGSVPGVASSGAQR